MVSRRRWDSARADAAEPCRTWLGQSPALKLDRVEWALGAEPSPVVWAAPAGVEGGLAVSETHALPLNCLTPARDSGDLEERLRWAPSVPLERPSTRLLHQPSLHSPRDSPSAE